MTEATWGAVTTAAGVVGRVRAVSGRVMKRCSAARCAVVAVSHVTTKSLAKAPTWSAWLPTRWAIAAMSGRSGARNTRHPAAAPNTAAALSATVAAVRLWLRQRCSRAVQVRDIPTADSIRLVSEEFERADRERSVDRVAVLLAKRNRFGARGGVRGQRRTVRAERRVAEAGQNRSGRLRARQRRGGRSGGLQD